ncbi:MAG: ferrous iron transport protein B [Acidipropionibacterium jensenii]|uniref:ferrous iron transport protein B n=1 Tax=Acidipropionibacterium jensenii TaxID=1749 RepID=UPI002647957A|nr:ferrous iron transport protein B [Acidipropionibacterium jensenii]MDN6811342.1 ferrous iron transport protein B [Acidipropionibacterium jensenii]
MSPKVAEDAMRELSGHKHRPVMSAKACCSEGPDESATGAPVVALAGAPNVGKSTLFNLLTGARVSMGNWPGTTVSVSRGVWHTHHTPGAPSDQDCSCPEGQCHCDHMADHDRDITLIDLPGAYSIDPMSPDEALTRALLVDCPPAEAPDLVVVVADAAHLSRSLYLVAQLRERPLRVVVALTMVDVARQYGIEIDTWALSDKLGVPVVSLDPRRRRGQQTLAMAVRNQLDDLPPCPREIALDPAELSVGPDALPATPTDTADTAGTGTADAAAADEDADLAREDERFAFIEDAVAGGTTVSGENRKTTSDKIDRWVTHKVFGPIIFAAVMWIVFEVTTTVAAPFQDWLDSFFSGPVSEWTHAGLAAIGLGDTWVNGLLVDGLIAGVGTVLTFAPLMALMFILLAILEDSGYMARAAVVTDRMMRRIGLPGRAFIPLIVGFGCNVPAISATRALPQARQRILTSLLVPFTSCTARLTVYVMLASTFFPKMAGTVCFIMYLVSIVLVVLIGMALRKTLWRTMGSEPLVLDLPPYQVPTARLTASVTWVRLKGFLRTASGIIVVAVAAVWLLQSIPVVGGAGFGEAAPEDSAFGVGASAVAPVFEPAGFGSWQTSSALVVGFVAKEAVLSSWAQTYAVDDPEETGNETPLRAKVVESFEQSSGGHTYPAVWAFLFFMLSYTPCVATLAVQKREIGIGWTLFGLAMQLAVAYIGAVAIFQIGSLLW